MGYVAFLIGKTLFHTSHRRFADTYLTPYQLVSNRLQDIYFVRV